MCVHMSKCEFVAAVQEIKQDGGGGVMAEGGRIRCAEGWISSTWLERENKR